MERSGSMDYLSRLEDVLAWKRAHARPKDLEHARLIERHLRGDSTQG